MNYLPCISGRDGVPLKYICRTNEDPDPTPHADFMDDYMSMAPLHGESFTIDASTVHTFIVNFISRNDTAEAKIQAVIDQMNGRIDMKCLIDHYKGVGIHSIDIAKTDFIFENLFYSGEKPPHMWWDEFKKQLTSAFMSYVKKESRIVHSNDMKLRILLDKYSQQTNDIMGCCGNINLM